MAPPLFKDLGKAAKDTLSDDYITEQKLELKSTTADGLVFTTTGTRNAAGAITASIQAKVPKNTTSVTGKIQTDGKILLDLISENAIKGLKLTVNAVPKGLGISPSAKVTCEYKASDATLSVVADPIVPATPLVASLAVGRGALFLGAEGEYSLKDSQFLGGQIGLQFAKGPNTFFAALQQVKSAQKCRASLLHTVNDNFSIAGEMSCNLKDTMCSVTVGVNSKLDDISSARVKMSSEGLLSMLYSYKLKKSTTLRLGVEVNTTAFDKDKHKVGVAFLVDEK